MVIPCSPVAGHRSPIGPGQRLDILSLLPRDGGAFPVLAQREGDRQRTGFILASPGAGIPKVPGLADTAMPPVDLSLERRLVALRGWRRASRRDPSHRPYRHDAALCMVDRRPGPGTITSLCAFRKGSGWSWRWSIAVMMAHPMHLHGHHFQVMAIEWSGAKRRDARHRSGAGRMASVTVAFDADNPGRWLLHCHNLFHMATGMMTEVAYERRLIHAEKGEPRAIHQSHHTKCNRSGDVSRCCSGADSN